MLSRVPTPSTDFSGWGGGAEVWVARLGGNALPSGGVLRSHERQGCQSLRLGGHRASAAVVASSSANTAAAPSQVTDRPRGVVADCAKGSGIGRGGSLNSVFRSRWNLVVGPLAMSGAAVTPAYYHPGFRGNKFPLYLRAGHRVTLALTRETRGRAGLAYHALPRVASPQGGYRVITFIACRQGEFSPGLGSNAGRLSFWAGGVRATAPMCVPLLIWVDDEPSARRAVIHLGVDECA